MKQIGSSILLMLIGALIMWFAVANIVFAFRHSWMTSTERLIWIKSAMTFRRVPYHEVRP